MNLTVRAVCLIKNGVKQEKNLTPWDEIILREFTTIASGHSTDRFWNLNIILELVLFSWLHYTYSQKREIQTPEF